MLIHGKCHTRIFVLKYNLKILQTLRQHFSHNYVTFKSMQNMDVLKSSKVGLL